MEGRTEPRRSVATLILAVSGAVLGLGGGSAIWVARHGIGNELGLAQERVEWTYALGSAALVLAASVAAPLLRWRGRWPFEPATEPPHRASWLALFLIAPCAGAGLGMYAGILNHLDADAVHVATAIAYFLLLPIAFLALAMGEPLRRGLPALLLLVLGVELGAQLGMNVGPRGRDGYWNDITFVNVVALAAGVVGMLFVAALKELLPRRLVETTRPGP